MPKAFVVPPGTLEGVDLGSAPAQPFDDEGLITLCLTIEQYAALQAAKQWLQENPKWYTALELLLQRVQPQREGPLSDLLKALVGV